MSRKGKAILSSKKSSQNIIMEREASEEPVVEIGVNITAVETDEEKEARENTRKKETPESSKVVETDEEIEEQRPSTSSSPSRKSFSLRTLLSRSPGKEEKSETVKPKKATKLKKIPKGKKKFQGAVKEPQVLADKGSLSTGKDEEGHGKRSMVQTNLSNTKEGTIEVISSPEQPQLKTQRKKSDKKSSSTKLTEKQNKEKLQTRITNLFPVRKSSRKCKTEQEKDENDKITEAILSKKNEGLEVRDIEGKGRGIFATRPFSKNEFICEYAGERISYKEAKKREKKYADDEAIGCYMYYLEYNNTKYCIDATEENGTFGRLLNHSRSGNCKTKLHIIKNKPHLVLVAKMDVEKGQELTYDYGDRSKGAIESHPWLKT